MFLIGLSRAAAKQNINQIGGFEHLVTHPTQTGQANAHGDNGGLPEMGSIQAQNPGF